MPFPILRMLGPGNGLRAFRSHDLITHAPHPVNKQHPAPS
jgi:hypothetical protein